MKSYIDELKDTIKRLHGVEAIHVETVPVKESFDSDTVWEGNVEVFELCGHPQINRAYAWMHGLDDKKSKRHVTVLGIPPITSPESAVKAVIVHEYKQQKNRRGRPPVAKEKALHRITPIRFTSAELKLYLKRARQNEQSLSEWIRETLKRCA